MKQIEHLPLPIQLIINEQVECLKADGYNELEIQQYVEKWLETDWNS